jgi:hypothetical protein
VRVFGVDFTSAPKKSKPIVIAECETDPEVRLVQFHTLTTLTHFEKWLHEFDGIAGIDAPFGFPSEFREALGLNGSWEAQANQIGSIGFEEVFRRANEFRLNRPVGNKEPRRMADVATSSVSSMKMYNPPIGRMAAKIIPLLAKTNASIFPVRVTDSDRVIFEIYCTPFARKVVGRIPYKNKAGLNQIRCRILSELPILVPTSCRNTIIEDDLGDYLDALIGAYEAQSAWRKVTEGQTLIPSDLDLLEGWTVSSIS